MNATKPLLHSTLVLPLILLGASPCFAQPDAPGPEAATPDRQSAAMNRDDARWADMEAQRRMTDGDYDGAVQAHEQAERDWREAQRQQNPADAR